MLNETFISPSSVKINLLSHINDEMIYTITLSGISGNGILKIYFPHIYKKHLLNQLKLMFYRTIANLFYGAFFSPRFFS